MRDIVERLRERSQIINHDAANEIERLREALREIADPIEYMRRRADQEGRKIDGHSAVFISNDVGFLKGIAAKAIEAFGQDRNGLDAKHESAVAESDLPQSSLTQVTRTQIAGEKV